MTRHIFAQNNMTKKIILFKSFILSFTMLASTCSAQSLSFNDLKGKWFDPYKNDSNSFFYFLDDMTLIISVENKRNVCYYKLDSSNAEERIIIRLTPEDTVHTLNNFIRRISKEKIALQNYLNLKVDKWEEESIYNTVCLVTQKENN